MIGKFIDIDFNDKYLHSHMVLFPSSTSKENIVKYVQCRSSRPTSNNCLRSCYNSKLVIMLSVCLLAWCGLLISALTSLSGAGSLNFDDGLDRRGETVHRGDTSLGKIPNDDSSLDARFAAIGGLVSGLESRIEDLEKRNRELELAVMIERSKPQEDEQLEQLVNQLEKGLIFLFPEFKEEEATRHLSSDERTTRERIMVLRDYLGNREAELAEFRSDLALELDRAYATAPPDLGTIGLALQQLSKENAVLRKRMEEVAQLVTVESVERQRGDEGGEMGNTVREVLTDEDDLFLDEAIRGRAADTRKSAFSVASSQPQLGLQGQIQYVTFDHLLSNKGGDYLFSNHSFVCRIPGFYFFTFTMRTYDHRYLGVVLMMNEEAQVAISTDQSDRSMSSSQSTILRLNAGDNVWLRMPPSENYGIYSDGAHYTTFSGFLVFSTAT